MKAVSKHFKLKVISEHLKVKVVGIHSKVKGKVIWKKLTTSCLETFQSESESYLETLLQALSPEQPNFAHKEKLLLIVHAH